MDEEDDVVEFKHYLEHVHGNFRLLAHVKEGNFCWTFKFT